MLAAILTLSALASLFGVLLGYSALRFQVEGDPIADQIDGLLPQTQCGQCGFPGCRPYAEALAKGEAEINLCLPGGEALVLTLADLLGREPVAMDIKKKVPSVAFIEPEQCIGCTRCIQACPIDAIIGATKQLHAVLNSECTGCGLCVEPCPVGCIEMRPIREDIQRWRWPYPGRQLVASDGLAPLRDRT